VGRLHTHKKKSHLIRCLLSMSAAVGPSQGLEPSRWDSSNYTQKIICADGLSMSAAMGPSQGLDLSHWDKVNRAKGVAPRRVGA